MLISCSKSVMLILFKCLLLFSRRLSDHAKQLFNRLGSAMIQNVNFRDVWVFMSQKGIKGFTEIEQVAIFDHIYIFLRSLTLLIMTIPLLLV